MSEQLHKSVGEWLKGKCDGYFMITHGGEKDDCFAEASHQGKIEDLEHMFVMLLQDPTYRGLICHVLASEVEDD